MTEVGGQPLQTNQNIVLQYLTASEDVLKLFTEPGGYERRCVVSSFLLPIWIARACSSLLLSIWLPLCLKPTVSTYLVDDHEHDNISGI